jgi:hypothetical protein
VRPGSGCAEGPIEPVSLHLLQGALAQMTQEQRIRRADAGIEVSLLVTGYEQPALEALVEGELCPAALMAQGAQAVVHTLYRVDCTLTCR